MALDESNLDVYITDQGMDTYTALVTVYTSDDDPRADDLKNVIVVSLENITSEPVEGFIWENTEIYHVDLYHAEKLSINRVRYLMQIYPSTVALYPLERPMDIKDPVYMGKMKNGMHHWAFSFDKLETVDVAEVT
jgi:hypothetical protein